jgi:hypothetical protein
MLWTDGRWRITALRPTVNPVALFIETVNHLDFGDLDEAMAAEFGVLTWRLEAAIRSIESVGRVHIHRWGDGSSHFHVWFQGLAHLAMDRRRLGSGDAGLVDSTLQQLADALVGGGVRDRCERFERVGIVDEAEVELDDGVSNRPRRLRRS